jgi:hypothetical protein
MRYQEFELNEDELFELKMSPTNLAKMAKNIDARAGMEFELIVPGVENEEEEYESEPDYDMDESFPTGRGWQRDIIDFFRGGDMGNSTRSIQRAIDELNENFWSWMDDESENFINSDEGQERAMEIATDNVSEDDYETTEEYQAALTDYINDNSDNIRDRLLDEFREDADSHFERFLEESGIEMMSDFANEHSLDWPYWSYPERDNSGGASIDAVADDFSQAIDRPVNAASSYHGARREAGHYVVEPDGSLQGDDGESGLEFVSPVLTVSEMLEDIDKVAKWARRVGAYTNDSTGLHMNVSVPDQANLDYVKLAMFLGDNYILEQFGRAGNTYCKSALNKIKQQAKQNPDRVEEMMRQFQNGLNQLASKMIHTGSTEKFVSINNRNGWIEFRSPGGDWLGSDLGPVKNTLLRAVVALDVATKPEEYKQEYYKKLVKTLQNPVEFAGARGERQQRVDKGTDDAISVFAKYAAGELPTSALKSFIRQIQTQREVKKQAPGSGKQYWWRVSRPGYSGSIEVVATTREEAIDKGTASDGYPSWRGQPDVRAEPSRPYEDIPQQTPSRDQEFTGTWEVVSRYSNNVIHTIRGIGNSVADAERHAARWQEDYGFSDPIYVRPQMQPRQQQPVAGSTQDIQRQRLAAQMPEYDTADGNWVIYDISNGNDVYRFVADTEEEAVRAFDIWQDAVREPSLPREGFNLRADPTPGTRQQQYRVTYTGRDGTNSVTVSAPNANAAMDRVRRQFYGSDLTNIEAEPATETPAQGTENLPLGTTRWRVLDQNDREIYSFVHRSNQGEANQYAANWLRQNGLLGRSEYMVVPTT